MHDVMRKRLMRKLEALPDEQLYQVLDFIEFLEAKYAPGERRSRQGSSGSRSGSRTGCVSGEVAPKAMSGTMKLIRTAGRFVDALAEAGQGVVEGLKSTTSGRRAVESASPREEPPAEAGGR